jgi:hypothetical protein
LFSLSNGFNLRFGFNQEVRALGFVWKLLMSMLGGFDEASKNQLRVALKTRVRVCLLQVQTWFKR